jgi:ParB-like nuclease domain
MQLEFHQLDRRWEHLRVRHPAQQRRLLASLAEAGQQTPIVVVAAEGQVDRYLVIDGYKRSAAGSFAALLRTRDRAGTGLAAGGVGAALRLWTRRTGAPL